MSGSSTIALGWSARRPAPTPPATAVQADQPTRAGLLEPLSALLTRRHADLRVATRPLTEDTRLTSHPEENSMSTLTADRIRDPCHPARTPPISATRSPSWSTGPETGQMGYLDFVDLLFEEEVGLREGRRFRNALELSGLPHHKTFDQFDFAFQPGLTPAELRAGLLSRRGASISCAPSLSTTPRYGSRHLLISRSKQARVRPTRS